MILRDRTWRAQRVGHPARLGTLRLRCVCGAGAGALALFVAGQSMAQMQAPGLSAAPLLPTSDARKVDFDVRAGVTYDSNIARANDAVADVKDIHPSDVLFQPAVRADVVLPVGVAAFFLNGSAGYDFYDNNKELQSARVGLLGGVMGRIGRCNSSLSDGYSVRQTDQADLPLQTTQNVQTTESVNIQGSCPVGHSLLASLNASTSTLDNSADIGVIDSRQSGVTGSLSYTNRLIGNIGLQAGYTTISYTSRDPLGRAQPGIEDYTLGVNFSRPIGNRFNGTASLSYSEIHSDDSAAAPDFSTWSGSGDLQYQVNPRLQLSLNYTRAAYPTVQVGYSYSLDQIFTLTSRYRLSSRFDTSVGVLWDNRDYRNPIGLVALTEINHENRMDIFGAITLHLLRGATLALDARYSDRNTNLTVFNYKDYRVGLTAAKSF